LIAEIILWEECGTGIFGILAEGALNFVFKKL